jgi:hypothetical protein
MAVKTKPRYRGTPYATVKYNPINPELQDYPKPLKGGNLDKTDTLFDFILRFLLIKR